MRLFFAVLLCLGALCFAREAAAAEPAANANAEAAGEAAAAAESVFLYTIGPHSDFPSRLGHALVCAREAGKDDPEHGRCFDYGVATSEDMLDVGWTAMRGRPNFVPVLIGESVMIEFFKGKGRAIERQRLPLAADEAKRLVGAMDAEVKAGQPFAYHPYWANCTTKLRDHIDAATNGKLQPGPSKIPPGTLRDYFEEGHSGRIFILTAMAIYFGEGNDVQPTPWQAMLVPAMLRDGVAERFGAKPEEVAERLEPVLPTSRALGRIVVFCLAALLFLTVRLGARRDRLSLALKIVGGTLGALAVTVMLTSALVTWPEIRHNWALLLLWPTDLALPYLKGRRLSLYLKARLAVAVAMAVLEIVGVVHQPVLQLVALVALPCAAILSALKSSKSVPETEPAPAV